MNIEANNPELRSFIEVDEHSDFPIQNLPFGAFIPRGETRQRLGVAIGDYVLDLDGLADAGLFDDSDFSEHLDVFSSPVLNPLMMLDKAITREMRNQISRLLRDDNPRLRDDQALRSTLFFHQDDVEMQLPVHVTSYTDFYSSKEHASNLGSMFRNPDDPLLPNWLHLPVGYDGRAGSVVVSGTNFHRPKGQLKPNPDEAPVYGPCKGMDIEVEMAFIVGKPTQMGDTISMEDAPNHIFGMVLLSDWSARDIQKWEYVPLGPFLGKNFATSISPWVVTLDALEPFRVASPMQDPTPLPYLQRKADWGLDINLSMGIKTPNMTEADSVSTMNFQLMYWDICQQLVHHAMGGCPMYAGDVLASGTISGTEKNQCGSLIELTWGGKNPVALSNAEERKFLQDGDTASISGYCQGNGYRIGFGQVAGTILPAK